jgi:hypothetical protein
VNITDEAVLTCGGSIGRLERARELLEKAVQMRERAVGPENPWLLPMLRSLQRCYELQGDTRLWEELQVHPLLRYFGIRHVLKRVNCQVLLFNRDPANRAS